MVRLPDERNDEQKTFAIRNDEQKTFAMPSDGSVGTLTPSFGLLCTLAFLDPDHRVPIPGESRHEGMRDLSLTQAGHLPASSSDPILTFPFQHSLNLLEPSNQFLGPFMLS